MANEPTVKCVRESDGYHAHTYRVWHDKGDGRQRPIEIERHMHTWMGEHKQLYPKVKDVGAHTLAKHLIGYWDTVTEAWKALGVAGEIPPVACRA